VGAIEIFELTIAKYAGPVHVSRFGPVYR